MYLETRPIVQSSVNNRFQEAFIQKIIGPSLLNVRLRDRRTRESESESEIVSEDWGLLASESETEVLILSVTEPVSESEVVDLSLSESLAESNTVSDTNS